jgi:lysine 2,3-aminomutase
MKTTGAETEVSSIREEEPPHQSFTLKEDEEPPSKVPSEQRRRFFTNVSDDNWNNWTWHFRNRLTTVEQLANLIPMTADEQKKLKQVTQKYPVSITPYYFSLIDPFNSEDPILKQAVPSFQEISLNDIGYEDPLAEERESVVPGLVHRYPDRVLMVLTDICPMLCRHCTRKREWRHGGWVRSNEEIDAMIGYIRNNKVVRDVVISGGDPLTLSTKRLEQVIAKLRQIDHVEIIRIGSRFPVVLPQRIDDELCEMLSKYSPIWLNTHFNHPREITPEAAKACDRLLRAGVPVNNQSVLLKGVNDNVETQLKLCQGLLKIKVRPYYLYQCDEVQGTEHLRTPVETGLKILEGMRGHTSGLAVPTFVIDLPDGGGKIPLQPNYVMSFNDEGLLLRNYQGHIFQYRNPKGKPSNGNGHKNGKRKNGSSHQHSEKALQMVLPVGV